MKIALYAAVPNVTLRDDTRPDGCSILALIYRDGEMIDRRWLPDGTIAERPDDLDPRDEPKPYPDNPLYAPGPGDQWHPMAFNPGEFLRLESGELAIVFNHKRGSKDRQGIS